MFVFAFSKNGFLHPSGSQWWDVFQSGCFPAFFAKLLFFGKSFLWLRHVGVLFRCPIFMILGFPPSHFRHFSRELCIKLPNSGHHFVISSRLVCVESSFMMPPWFFLECRFFLYLKNPCFVWSEGKKNNLVFLTKTFSMPSSGQRILASQLQTSNNYSFTLPVLFLRNMPHNNYFCCTRVRGIRCVRAKIVGNHGRELTIFDTNPGLDP